MGLHDYLKGDEALSPKRRRIAKIEGTGTAPAPVAGDAEIPTMMNLSELNLCGPADSPVPSYKLMLLESPLTNFIWKLYGDAGRMLPTQVGVAKWILRKASPTQFHTSQMT